RGPADHVHKRLVHADHPAAARASRRPHHRRIASDGLHQTVTWCLLSSTPSAAPRSHAWRTTDTSSHRPFAAKVWSFRLCCERPRGRGGLGVLSEEPRPLRLPDVSRHPQSFGRPPGHPAMHTFLGVAILIRGQALGNLYVTVKEDGHKFTGADEEAAIVLAQW